MSDPRALQTPSAGLIEPTMRTYLLLRILWRLGKGKPWLFFMLSLAFFALFPAAALVVCSYEGTLRLGPTNGGRGLLEHYGSWSQFIGCPVLIFFTLLLIQRLDRALALDGLNGHEYSQLLATAKDFLTRATPIHKILFAILALFGVFSLIINAQGTRSPIDVYGQQLWDSSAHTAGYILGRIFLGFEWIYVFPLVIYLALGASIIIILLVNIVMGSAEFELSAFAPDGCGGVRPIGSVMLSVAYIDLPFIAIIVAHIYTHANFYASLMFASLLAIVGVTAQAFLPFLRLHDFLKRHKVRRLADLEKKILRNRWADTEEKDDGPLARHALALVACDVMYRKVADMRTWPYARIDWMQWLVPLVPVVAALVERGFPPGG